MELHLREDYDPATGSLRAAVEEARRLEEEFAAKMASLKPGDSVPYKPDTESILKGKRGCCDFIRGRPPPGTERPRAARSSPSALPRPEDWIPHDQK
jgi:hypothetical protein